MLLIIYYFYQIGHPAIICEFYTPILKNDQKDQ